MSRFDVPRKSIFKRIESIKWPQKIVLSKKMRKKLNGSGKMAVFALF
jgi:hypothetical protein